MNKNIIALGFVSFFTDMATSMITPLIPILVVYILHNDVQTLSQVVAISTFISYAFRVLFGYLGDRFQLVKPFVVTGYLISAIVKPLFYFVSSWQSVAAIQSIERMGKAIRSASKDTLISAYAAKKQSGKTFGFHKAMDIAGELFGAILVVVILALYGQSETVIKAIFAITVIPGVVAVIIVYFCVVDTPYRTKKTHYEWQRSDTKLLPLLFLYFIFLAFVFSSSFFVIKANEVGYNIAYIPLFFIVLNLTQTVTSYYFGLTVDKLGVINILLLSFVFGVFAQVSLYFGFMWVAFAFLGLFTVSSMNAIRSYISQHAVNKSTVYGVFYAGTALFSALGALVFGYVWTHFSGLLAIQISAIGTAVLTLALALNVSKIQIENRITGLNKK